MTDPVAPQAGDAEWNFDSYQPVAAELMRGLKSNLDELTSTGDPAMIPKLIGALIGGVGAAIDAVEFQVDELTNDARERLVRDEKRIEDLERRIAAIEQRQPPGTGR